MYLYLIIKHFLGSDNKKRKVKKQKNNEILAAQKFYNK